MDSKAVPEASVFEKIAKQRGTKFISSEEVGRIDSSDARAIITALIIENSHYRPSRVRGIRIDLSNQTSSDQLYLEEGELVYLKHELDGLDCGVASMRSESGAPYRVRGIGRCRPSQSVPQAYCPGYYIGPDSEGLSLSTFSGGNFRFPSARPSVLADAIGRAMSKFGLDDSIPTPDPIELPADDLDQIVASAVQYFPELASSPGIKAAGYSDPDSKSSAWAIFWPYERLGDMAYSRLVDCDAIGTGGGGWKCDRGRPRAYLTIPDQEFEVVITDELDRETAIALIDFARLRLQEEANYADLVDWKFTLIRVPDQSLEAFLVAGSDVAYGSISFVIEEAPQDVEERFELVRTYVRNRNACGG
ncbi:MAG: hypothetical protein IIB77_05540 [Proteobacteria bacterium]|nr:hypothetical protein [Pseudomonadota bacterium]